VPPRGVLSEGRAKGDGEDENEEEEKEEEEEEGRKAFGMAAKETAVVRPPSRCVRQPGYISRVNDSGISISVSVRWLSLPTLPG